MMTPVKSGETPSVDYCCAHDPSLSRVAPCSHPNYFKHKIFLRTDFVKTVPQEPRAASSPPQRRFEIQCKLDTRQRRFRAMRAQP